VRLVAAPVRVANRVSVPSLELSGPAADLAPRATHAVDRHSTAARPCTCNVDNRSIATPNCTTNLSFFYPTRMSHGRGDWAGAACRKSEQAPLQP